MLLLSSVLSFFGEEFHGSHKNGHDEFMMELHLYDIKLLKFNVQT